MMAVGGSKRKRVENSLSELQEMLPKLKECRKNVAKFCGDVEVLIEEFDSTNEASATLDELVKSGHVFEQVVDQHIAGMRASSKRMEANMK